MVHILRIAHKAGKPWRPICSCQERFARYDTHAEARVALTAHVMAAAT